MVRGLEVVLEGRGLLETDGVAVVASSQLSLAFSSILATSARNVLRHLLLSVILAPIVLMLGFLTCMTSLDAEKMSAIILIESLSPLILSITASFRTSTIFLSFVYSWCVSFQWYTHEAAPFQ